MSAETTENETAMERQAAESGEIAPEQAKNAPDQAVGGAAAESGADEAEANLEDSGGFSASQAEADAELGRLKPILSRSLEEFRPYHSGFQIDRFILGVGAGTSWGAFTQAAREIATRVESLKLDYVAGGRLQVDLQESINETQAATSSYYNLLGELTKRYRKIEDDNERSEKVQIKASKKWAAMKRAELDRTEVIMQLDAHKRSVADKERELGRFLAHFEELRAELEMDGPLDEARKEKLEAELWETKAKIAIAAEITTMGGIGSETLGLINAMSSAAKERLIAFSKIEPEDIQLWYLNRMGRDLKSAPDKEVVRRLLCS